MNAHRFSLVLASAVFALAGCDKGEDSPNEPPYHDPPGQYCVIGYGCRPIDDGTPQPGYYPDDGLPLSCPKMTDDVNDGRNALGRLRVFIRDLYAGPGNDDLAYEIIDMCGWRIFGSNNGGFGNTLRIVSPNGAIILTWADNRFVTFTLKQGWVGGVRLDQFGPWERVVHIGDQVSVLYEGGEIIETSPDATQHDFKPQKNGQGELYFWTKDGFIVRVCLKSPSAPSVMCSL